jgi:hypothetical protein
VRSCLTLPALCKIVSLVGVCLLGTPAAGAATRQVTIAPAHAEQFVGSAGCKSSSCHGGAGEKRSQYITWTQQDFHTRGYAVLVNARSARMAETLHLDSATSSSRCTVCHSPFQTLDASRLTDSSHVDQGVSCESCHNAAGPWFRGHTRPDWTYAMRVTAGMRDLRNFYVRANTCVACHQNVDTEVLAAGHPVLRFELDGQSVAEPKHWWDPTGSGAKAWLVGQAVALREMSWALGDMASPGPELIGRWNALVWLLSKATAQAGVGGLDAPGPPYTHAVFIDMQQRADSLARRAAETSLGNDFARATLQSLTTTNSEFLNSGQSQDVLFWRAERLAPALNRMAVASGADSDVSPRPETRALFDAIQNPGSFDAVRFAKAIETYGGAVTNSSPSDGQ